MDDPKRFTSKHELANALSAILAETQLVLMRAEAVPPDILESLVAIESSALRMQALMRDLGTE